MRAEYGEERERERRGLREYNNINICLLYNNNNLRFTNKNNGADLNIQQNKQNETKKNGIFYLNDRETLIINDDDDKSI